MSKEPRDCYGCEFREKYSLGFSVLERMQECRWRCRATEIVEAGNLELWRKRRVRRY